ncbi:MAG: 23S rRNA methyltransferase, partial [Micavibrio sp.]|nr:23S rRNA methyltransferase [Micavibrio sp.]
MSRNKAKTKVRTAKGRKNASTRWLKRQLNDPYVTRAKQDGLRGRAAYKLIELNEKLDFLKPGQVIVDLGAAPGGWCQVATKHGARVAAIDLLEM